MTDDEDVVGGCIQIKIGGQPCVEIERLRAALQPFAHTPEDHAALFGHPDYPVAVDDCSMCIAAAAFQPGGHR